MTKLTQRHPIGIMQGRLSPPVSGRTQSFPVETWHEEFFRAREASLDCIEWVYEAETETYNPMSTLEGIAQIRQAIENSGVSVWSVCADFYMTQRLVGPDGTPQPGPVEHLVKLVERATPLGIRHIVLPFVDQSSLGSESETEGLLAVLKVVLSRTEGFGVELHLETDFKPAALLDVLQRVSHPLIRANYDIGNSASLGHDPEEELTLISPWLGSVHVKDRVLGGGTVPLGTGSADFPTCFRLIRDSGFSGPMILQAAREEGITEVALARRNSMFVQNGIAASMSTE